ncbi:hypothetical protein PHYSODRAFT_308115 [Phytophthora sojae]|uniref:Uncharacterized protein n=1 Tax=Phytophthora sojae (strain P6497) TaxID=1094619 RepID=G5AI93_PHYSP|nr:hypothetical protein PHYSODRAFT_300921 [Phytophthora sojae]XP_009539794.1 hypothetical protein PHYSODRAFT_308115 [Phytophthora sojae]EGZ04818.1 hypothetical protein PHYSODRAFT_308115 [Phytophthora sojae]EGZ18131.1 hypothetical protein PHYSODRAFT_300921 [Phytophthora sojae]|eukprot:XP_009527189.1 hypothetical protein PHYSODRAFT_300921 [Phytophthora sojae]
MLVVVVLVFVLDSRSVSPASVAVPFVFFVAFAAASVVRGTVVETVTTFGRFERIADFLPLTRLVVVPVTVAAALVSSSATAVVVPCTSCAAVTLVAAAFINSLRCIGSDAVPPPSYRSSLRRSPLSIGTAKVTRFLSRAWLLGSVTAAVAVFSVACIVDARVSGVILGAITIPIVSGRPLRRSTPPGTAVSAVDALLGSVALVVGFDSPLFVPTALSVAVIPTTPLSSCCAAPSYTPVVTCAWCSRCRCSSARRFAPRVNGRVALVDSSRRFVRRFTGCFTAVATSVVTTPCALVLGVCCPGTSSSSSVVSAFSYASSVLCSSSVAVPRSLPSLTPFLADCRSLSPSSWPSSAVCRLAVLFGVFDTSHRRRHLLGRRTRTSLSCRRT